MSFAGMFQGGVFDEQIPGGRASGTIEFSYEGVQARTAAGDLFLVSFGDCQLEIGGSSGRMVFCHNADRSRTIYCDDKRFLAALEQASRGLLADRLAAVTQGKRVERRRAFLWTSVTILIAVALVYGGFRGVRAAGRASIRALPRSFDEQLGELAFEAADLQGPKVTDPEITGPVDKIVERLAAQVGIPEIKFRVTVVRAEITNAFALPGGQIVVYTGLMAQARRPEQLAGVLAHEMSHVTRRHSLQQLSNSLGTFVLLRLVLGDVRGMARLGAEILNSTAANQYSREQEAEADRDGVELLHRAGIDPAAMAEFFQILRDEEGDLPGAFSWISTHPSHENRIAAIRSHLEKLPRREYSPLQDVDWAQVQARLKAP